MFKKGTIALIVVFGLFMALATLHGCASKKKIEEPPKKETKAPEKKPAPKPQVKEPVRKQVEEVA